MMNDCFRLISVHQTRTHRRRDGQWQKTDVVDHLQEMAIHGLVFS